MKCNINALNASAVEPNQFQSQQYIHAKLLKLLMPNAHEGKYCSCINIFVCRFCWGNCGHFLQLKALHIWQSIYIYEIIK